MKGNSQKQKAPYKGRKQNRGRGRGRQDCAVKEDAQIKDKRDKRLSSLNDISWYSQYPELLAAAARIPFPFKAGMDIVPGDPFETGNDYRHAIPGVLEIDYAPTVGYSDSVQSPSSIVAKEMWARVRSKFSGALDEDPPDLFMYALALDSLHAFHAEVKRIYRTLNVYTPYNRDYPYHVLMAMGLSAAQIEYWQQHKMDLYGIINTMAHKINKFSVPENMDIYDRHRFMNENVYLDRGSANSQSYVFKCLGYYVVNDAGAKGTELHYTPKTDSTYDNVASLMAYFNVMCDALSGWGDAYTICGHIERAYEGEQFYYAELIAQDEMLTPVYVPEVLTQIENLTISSFSNENASLNVTQEPTTNAILCAPKLAMSYMGPLMINLEMDNPTAADVTIATRLTTCKYGNKAICGTEIVNALWFVGRFWDGTKFVDTKIPFNVCSVYNTDAAARDVLQYVDYYAAFAHHPLAFMHDAANKKTIYNFDVMNITPINPEVLEQIHTVCLFSEFNCFRD